MTKAQIRSFVVCIDNDGYAASLKTRKIYVAVPDVDAGQLDLLKVIDESGDEYIYPKAQFQPIELSPAVQRAILTAA